MSIPVVNIGDPGLFSWPPDELIVDLAKLAIKDIRFDPYTNSAAGQAKAADLTGLRMVILTSIAMGIMYERYKESSGNTGN